MPSTFEITQANLTVTGLVVNNKEYDGTTEATTLGTPVLSGVISNDNVVLDASPFFTFESPEVGTNITISFTGFTIAGTNNGNYSLTQPFLSADITQRAITLTASLQEKNYGNMLVLDDTAFTVTDLDNDAHSRQRRVACATSAYWVHPDFIVPLPRGGVRWNWAIQC